MSGWQPITDLPEDWRELASPELASLLQVWAEQSDELKNSRGRAKFIAELKREWAIETGIIEGIYYIDRGTTVELIEHGIKASLIAHGASNRPAEEIIDILGDHQEALDWVFDVVAQRRPLSTGYVKDLNQLLTRHQDVATGRDQFGNRIDMPLLKGTYKMRPNNPTRPEGTIYYFAPPEHVDSEMDQLFAWHGRHVAMSVPPEVEAAWFHHRFTQIHPFQDGNGRVARALATFILLRGHGFPLSIERGKRNDYITALEAADTGNLQPFVQLITQLQLSYLRKVTSISDPPH